jgi:tetratricopeptide (TPR) repeat protein
LPIQLNSPDWSIGKTAPSRGSRLASADAAPNFPAKFLTEESEVAEEFIAQPKTATRGQSEGSGALDFSYDLAADEAAILSIRHPSGALTFHLPVQSTSRGLRQPNQVRFTVTVRSTDEATGTRGIASKAIKAILIKVGKTVVDKAVSFVLPKLAAAFERDAWEKNGLKEGWLSVTKETLGKKELAPKKPVSTERSLLFIHGTFSNAASAYGSLAESNFFDRVKPVYGDRIFAFDHFTVSRTPEENARMLLEGLPDQTTTFDVITHSRGGLVLRNLVERVQVFGPLAQRFKVGRAVLVASPNQGTPLATPQRWGDTVGWIANLLEMFPDNPFTTGAAFVANGLVWLARHASGDLPGLHSMDGAGELIAELQAPPDPSADVYSALVANYNPTKEVLLRMLDTGIDQFFGSANDLVVPSEGGWHVGQPGKVLIPAARIGCYGPGGNLAADSVTHVSFFSRPETVDFLVLALSGHPQALKGVNPLASLPDRRLLREGKAAFATAASVAEPEQGPVSAGQRPFADVRKTSTRHPLQMTVVNGDLTFENEPLLIGHYRASKLTGTEKVMNDLIGGAMQRSLALGVYPMAPGSHQVFVNTQPNPESVKRMPRPKAVIVVGLGEEGRLSAGDLVRSVRQAVIRWAQRTIEQDKRVPAIFDLSTTLLGSGGTGVTAGEAAQRIAQGVYEANELLRGQRKSDGKAYPRVGQLRLIELYLDRATEAWRSLKMQATATPDRYEITKEVKTGTGPLPRPLDSGYRGADYDFITAEAVREKDGQTSIKYTLDTKRARSEVRAQKTQGQLLRDLVATASSAQNHDRQIGRTLFKLLVPVEMEAVLVGTGEMQIELEPETAGIPWELLDTDDGDDRDPGRRPWAIRTKLLRKLRTTDYRAQVTDATVDSNILVIGEPLCPKNYPRLFAAREEAVAVYECLASSDGVGKSRVKGLFSDDSANVGPDARTVINALLERPWRIAHIAGHGELLTEDGRTGGVVLSSGAFLGPNEIATMRAVPELVFVNCCHLAARNVDQLLAADTPPSYDRPRFASGVAEQLIKIGVRCVIAAGWAVDDMAARTFATTFYTSLLRGNRFIDAVAQAREAAYSKDDNTWAAYQCYGDPDWIFRRDLEETDVPSTTSVDEFSGVASAAALKLTLETIVVQTKFQHFKAQVQLERVRSLEKSFAPKWGENGFVAELFGAAYLAARDIDSALKWYERAVHAEDGTASLRAAEQLANVRVRHAWETVNNARNQRDNMTMALKKASKGSKTADRKARVAAKRSLAAAERALRASVGSARESIREATTLLEKLVSVHPTMERESIYASAYKRLALVEAAAGRRGEEPRAIEGMKLHYERAAEIAREEKLPNAFYPALNQLAAELALNAGRRGWKGLDASIVKSTRSSLDAKSKDDPDFWSVVGQTELQLYEDLAGGKLASKRTALEKGYQDLYRRVSAQWLWSSAYDTTQFVLQKYSARASAKESKAAEGLLAFLAGLARRSGVP